MKNLNFEGGRHKFSNFSKKNFPDPKEKIFFNQTNFSIWLFKQFQKRRGESKSFEIWWGIKRGGIWQKIGFLVGKTNPGQARRTGYGRYGGRCTRFFQKTLKFLSSSVKSLNFLHSPYHDLKSFCRACWRTNFEIFRVDYKPVGDHSIVGDNNCSFGFSFEAWHEWFVPS